MSLHFSLETEIFCVSLTALLTRYLLHIRYSEYSISGVNLISLKQNNQKVTIWLKWSEHSVCIRKTNTFHVNLLHQSFQCCEIQKLHRSIWCVAFSSGAPADFEFILNSEKSSVKLFRETNNSWNEVFWNQMLWFIKLCCINP